MDRLTIKRGDALAMLAELEDESVNCCVTSPPYWGLRDYGVAGQLGLEKTPEEYVARMVEIFREVRRVLRKDGTCFVNLGDAYAHLGACGGGSPLSKPTDGRVGDQSPRGRKDDRVAQLKTKGTLPPGLKPKDLCGIPWRVAFALQADGWWLRQDIIWAKPNPMPESVTDRCTKAHEYIFLLTKSARYWWDQKAVRVKTGGEISFEEYSKNLGEDWQKGRNRKETDLKYGMLSMPNKPSPCSHPDGANRRSVWEIATQPYPEAHFATFPEELPKLCILAGCPAGGTLLDPFAGSGTTGKVALELGRKAILIELNPEYVELIKARCNTTPGFSFLDTATGS